MPLLPLSLLVLLLLLAPKANGVYAYGEKRVLSFDKFTWKERSKNPSCFSPVSRMEKRATILEVNHQGYCSGHIKNWNRRLQKQILSDNIRVQALQSRMKKQLLGGIQDLSQAQIPLTSGVKLQTLNYIVSIGLGSRNMTVIVDTGSDLTWVQCQPCRSCYNQPDPLFDPALSPSYQTVPCHSPTCQNLQFATGSPGFCGSAQPSCNYYVSYGDGSYSRGNLATDSLVLGGTPVKGFVFGCGRYNKGLFGGTSGLMGLGRSALSLISQTSSVFEGVFSYCLPSMAYSGSGSLILGGDSSVFKNFTPISYTRMIPDPMLPTFYFVNLTGISIGGVSVQESSFGKGQMLIDSGTVITRLPPSVYNAVKSEFLKQFSGFPSAPSYSILDTCFNLSSYEEVEIPTVKIHFEGESELTVDVTGVLYFAKTDASQACLALASLSDDGDVGIIGNYQQRNTRVIYNVKESMLGFAKETCSSI